jgi:hypothetical protein
MILLCQERLRALWLQRKFLPTTLSATSRARTAFSRSQQQDTFADLYPAMSHTFSDLQEGRHI